jgi:hypothetical protein
MIVRITRKKKHTLLGFHYVSEVPCAVLNHNTHIEVDKKDKAHYIPKKSKLYVMRSLYLVGFRKDRSRAKSFTL